MADEQANAEQTASEETNTEEESSGSEVATERSETQEESAGGDLKVALSQERQRIKEIKEQLSDPNFIYQRAVELGLAEQEAEAAQNNAATDSTAQSAGNAVPAGMTYQDYQLFRSLEKAQEKYPDLAKNRADQMAVSTIIDEEGLSPEKAAEKFYSRFDKAKEEAKAEGAKQQEQTITEKEKAQTASGVATSGDATEIDNLREQVKYGDRVSAKSALAELVKKMDEKDGII